MRLITVSLVLLGSHPLDAMAKPWLERLSETISPALRRTEQRLAEIAAELPTLPNPPGIPSGISSGFSTNPVLPGQEQQWLEVILPEAAEIDSVVLIPAVSLGAGRPKEGFGFPQRFKLIADAGDGTPLWTILDQTAADFPNPGIHPVVCRFSPRRVQRVRLQVTKSWQEDAPSVLALAEMMLLVGHRNLAAGARRSACPPWPIPPPRPAITAASSPPATNRRASRSISVAACRSTSCDSSPSCAMACQRGSRMAIRRG